MAPRVNGCFMHNPPRHRVQKYKENCFCDRGRRLSIIPASKMCELLRALQYSKGGVY